METKYVDCPNCYGSGNGDLITLVGGRTQRGKCVFCTGSGSVPEWDYERLKLIVIEKKTTIQMELELKGFTDRTVT